MHTQPNWIDSLEPEDLNFIKKFILASGSLKEIAKAYQVTYPTVRLRLDKLIQKIKLAEDTQKDPYISLIQNLALSEKIEVDVAKTLIHAYKNQIKE
ncbi:Protein of unknown function [Amphibacillus marinus]|uniref:DUF2089 domain-containing protein n=1 Tax=Amphibacillus marinus TaxID=872970 RepID=A0A1H8LH04_9BACI|nr:DUF2089 family protein [Amphibacillus marinus]SEO04028.1 Protein of unknown function [Amphibacillus marinus]